MIQIKLIKDTELHKAGEIINCSKKDADGYVSNGIAEYIEKPKWVKEAEKDMKNLEREYNQEKRAANIYANANGLKELQEKYKAVNLDEIIERKVKYYRLNPFEGRNKLIWIEKIKEYIELINEDVPEEQYKPQKTKIQSLMQAHFTKINLAEEIYDIQPYFYDNSKIWWLWDSNNYRWKIVDDKDILNLVKDNSDANTVNSKEKNEILEAMEQYGRKQIPKPIKKTWIQFKNKIIDYKTGEELEATPEYFVTNPIPWSLHKERFIETPIIDKIFEEWVGKDYVQTLYEIIAYSLIPDYPIHRLFCFIGEGLNGKSCFLRLLEKFVGKDNSTATELDTLISSRFEITKLHKKLVCIMGETNFAEISKTSIIKKLTGQDTIGFEYKNKNPFDDFNYAKILIATNNLPSTTDKTIGFYRRWCIIDFPNRFSEQRDILEDIPEEEYEILAVKSLKILLDLINKKSFNKEGSIEERKEKYESKSNFLEEFIHNFTIENIDGFITKADFYKKFLDWCKENRHRQVSETSLSLDMKKAGYEGGTKYFNWMNDGRGGNARIWLGLSWKE